MNDKPTENVTNQISLLPPQDNSIDFLRKQELPSIPKLPNGMEAPFLLKAVTDVPRNNDFDFEPKNKFDALKRSGFYFYDPKQNES